MTLAPEFALVPIGKLRVHEEIYGRDLAELVDRIQRDGHVEEPILVARDSFVILNGHHRYAALRQLGARKAPAWIVDYEAPEIVVDRWRPGPAISKEEVVRRAREGRPFPPKTTRHRLLEPVPHRATPLEELRTHDGADEGSD